MRTVLRTGLSLVLVAAVFGTAVVVGMLAGTLTMSDTAFVVERFQRDVVVEPSGRLLVSEQLDVRFTEPRRGIFRDLPRDAQAGAVTYADFVVDRGEASEPWPFAVEFPDNDITRLRIGDPDVTLPPGVYRYRIGYTIDGLAFVDEDRPDEVEIRLDVPGFSWPTRIAETALRVALPGEVLAVDCVAGTLGSTEDCPMEPIVTDRQVGVMLGSFGAERSATVEIRADAAAFTGALPIHRPDPLRGGLRLPALPTALAYALLLVAPLGVFEAVKTRRVYRDVTTDPALHDRAAPTAIPEPPDDMSPVEVAGVLRRGGDDLFLATLVELDQRGAVHVEVGAPVPDPNPGATRRQRRAAEQAATAAARRATVTLTDPQQLRPDEVQFVEALLPDGGPLQFTGTYDAEVASRSSAATSRLTSQANTVMHDRGMLHDEGGRLRRSGFKALLFLGWVVWAAVLGGLVVLLSPLWFVAVGIQVVVTVLAWASIRALWSHERLPLNSHGRDTIARTRAFEEYLRTVEADQFEWAASQPSIDQRHPAVRLLPYAIALGLAASWYERFGDLMARVAAGTAAGATTAGGAWWASSSSFATLSTSRSASVTSPSSSGGGGSGGGSGGGGGGGGSW